MKSKWYLAIVSIILGTITTITSLLLSNFERIQQWKEAKKILNSSQLPTTFIQDNIYKTILLDPMTFVIMFLSSISFAIIFMVLDYIIHKEKETKPE